MTLKSIELIGFKSFGRKSSVQFTTPITAVVGPNGSGKSNIVEAIRFVLGEQSMKSLRGKGGVDLIFKGSKAMPSANHAKVTITFDNSKKIFSFSNSGLGVSLDYDEVSISREVFTDGGNIYSINDTEVRLKDVIDLLASVNIGSSGHHIISQGEADRVLNASNKDRRTMIEDALGLKVYQYRIRESERKLDKTIINMKEVQASRRELGPHLAFLKKQVQVIEKAREMREDLKALYKNYFSTENFYIRSESKRLKELRHDLEKQIQSIDKNIEEVKKEKSNNSVENEYSNKIKDEESKLLNLRRSKDELSRKLGRLEGVIDSIETKLNNVEQSEDRSIPASEWQGIIEYINEQIDQALQIENIKGIIDILKELKHKVGNINNLGSFARVDEKVEKEYEEMKSAKDSIVKELEGINEKEKLIISTISELREKEKDVELSLREGERVLYELLGHKNVATSSIHSLSFEEEKLNMVKGSFDMELSEAKVLIGHEVSSYVDLPILGEADRILQEDLRRKIERIKIKLEDIGSGSGADVMKEYQETEERDQFLAREIIDLTKGVEDCRLLIVELKETLDTEFKHGVEKINKQFQDFFALMFGGGSAFLSVVMEHRKSRARDEEEEIEIEEEEELGFERGIEINVTLPHKKVKDLHMLSGGERSLASIALLFAISQVNPPPFLVLDETDAALDEANSRKYGNMLENLSKYSQLVVVTHNRETMSRAQVLYGVTMDSSGASKLLSIHLEDASAYAK